MNSPARSLAVCVVLGIIGLGACDGTERDRSASGTSVRDSAGVKIFTSAQAERRLALAEVLRIGVVEGDPRVEFSRVRDIAVDTHGDVWVVDSHEGVRHYDSAGSYIGVVGRVGRGPGEAQSYARVLHTSDEVLLLGFPAILQRFSRSGEFRASRLARTSDGSLVIPLGHAAGRWVFALRDYRTAAAPKYRLRTHIVVAADLADKVDTLLTFPGELSRQVAGGEIGRSSYFHGNPSYAIDATGRLFVSDTVQYQILVYGVRGEVIRVMRRSATPRPYEPGWQAQIENAVTSALRRPGWAFSEGERDRLVASILPDPPPAHLPFIQRLVVGRDGAVLVERADRHPRPAMRAVAHAFGYARHAWPPEWKAPQVFDVYDPNGEYVGTIELPDEYEPMTVLGNRVYGVAYDELGVEYVLAYDFRAPAAQP